MLITTLLHDGGAKEIMLPVTDNLSFFVDAGNTKSFNPAVSTTTWHDISRDDSPIKGTLQGNAKYVASDGGIIFLDGDKDWVDFGTEDAFQIGTSSFTVFYVVKFNAFKTAGQSHYGTVFEFRTPFVTQAGLSDYWFESNGKGGIGMWDYAGNLLKGTSPLVPTQVWMSVSLTHDAINKQNKLYFNGVHDPQVDFWRDSFNYSSKFLRLGANEQGNSMNGSLAAFILYKGGFLSPSEVKETHDMYMKRFYS